VSGRLQRSPEIFFGDIDLAVISTFDLGTEVDVERLLGFLKQNLSIMEAYWNPRDPERILTQRFSEKVWKENRDIWSALQDRGAAILVVGGGSKEQRIQQWAETKYDHDKFGRLVEFDIRFLPEYNRAESRYVRFKLGNFSISLSLDRLGELNLRCIPFALIHKGGILSITVYVPIQKKLDTDQVIQLRELLSSNKQFTIRDSIGSYTKSLKEYEDQIAMYIQFAAHEQGTSWKSYEEYLKYVGSASDTRKGELHRQWQESLRTPIFKVAMVVCLRSIEDANGKLYSPREAVEKNARELASIVIGFREWQIIDLDKAKEYVGHNLSFVSSDSFFISTTSGLWIGERGIGNDLDFWIYEVTYLESLEFLLVWGQILFAQSEAIKKRSSQKLTAAQFADVKRQIRSALDEYDDTVFGAPDPAHSIFEYGKKVLGYDRMYQLLLTKIDELEDRSRTIFEEQSTEKQLVLAILFGVISIVSIGSFAYDVSTQLKLVMSIVSMLISAIVVITLYKLRYRVFLHRRKTRG
jgi:hypothetical protein